MSNGAVIDSFPLGGKLGMGVKIIELLYSQRSHPFLSSPCKGDGHLY
jgi:hypothetical protein